MKPIRIHWLPGLLLLCCWCAASAAVPASELRWLDHGRPTAHAWQALALLSDAASHGLDPQDYHSAALMLAAQAATPARPARPDLEQALTRSMQLYLRDLHQGRVDPRLLGVHFRPLQRPDFDPMPLLRKALAAGDLEQAVRLAQPRLPQYQELRAVLAQYRALGQHPAWQQALPALPPKPGRRLGLLKPGQSYAGLALLAERLRVLGDLPPSPDPVPQAEHALTLLYQGALVQAVRAFQARHGLLVDGVLGPNTLAQIELSPAARVRQIELALERLRWMPLQWGPRMVVVNVPEFVLRGYLVIDGRSVVQTQMNVIVGRARDARTPLFDADIQVVEFSPYWHVPVSIARRDIVPRMRRDPTYFSRMGFDFVWPDGRVDAAKTAARLDAVAEGSLRLRQRPGPHNAMGDVKLVLPNPHTVLLHHTPAVDLFARDRRDFSSGCIRVEKPLELVQFVLGDQPGWTRQRIAAALAAEQMRKVRLNQPVPVLIVYLTARVEQGRIYFFRDIYGHDRRLQQALQQRSQLLQRQRQRLPLAAD